MKNNLQGIMNLNEEPPDGEINVKEIIEGLFEEDEFDEEKEKLIAQLRQNCKGSTFFGEDYENS